MKNIELIQQAIDFIDFGETQNAIDALNRFLITNTPRPKTSKVNIFDWVSKDTQLRLNLCGVFHDHANRVAVATDAHFLIVSKSDFIENLTAAAADDMNDGYIISKKGDYINNLRYPDYQRVIPTHVDKNGDSVDYIVNINRAELADKLQQAKARNKVSETQINGICLFKFDDNTPYVMSLQGVKLMLTLPDDVIFTYDFKSDNNNRPLKAHNDNYTAVFMPRFWKPEDNDVMY